VYGEICRAGWAVPVMANILIEFVDFPQHQEILGRLLIAYGELEWALTLCVQHVLGATPSESTRILFRVKGVTSSRQWAALKKRLSGPIRTKLISI
jgi:hypothetical protein